MAITKVSELEGAALDWAVKNNEPVVEAESTVNDERLSM